jgi:hypothetical protein
MGDYSLSWKPDPTLDILKDEGGTKMLRGVPRMRYNSSHGELPHLGGLRCPDLVRLP